MLNAERTGGPLAEERRTSLLKAVGRSVLAVLAGLIAGSVLIAAIEGVSSLIYPLPSGLDPNDYDALRRYVDELPVGAFLFVLAAWAVGSFAGGWIAARLAGRAALAHGLIVGVFFLAAGLVNLLMIPHPVWMWVGGIAVLAGGGYVGARLGRR
jgi:hypothetical protein